MTAKQAIKARCRDCLAGSRTCSFDDCALKGLSQAKKGTNRTAAIRLYCQWYMNRNPVNQCASTDCAIYQYRASYKGALKVHFLPVNPRTNDVSSPSEPKPIDSYGKGDGASESALLGP